VSEADIVRREAGDDRRRGALGWLPLERAPAKLEARTAGEAMSSPPIVIQPQRDVAEAARLMTERVVNRLPVVEADEKLVGIVTRADLVRVFVRSDDEVARELREDVVVDTLWIDPASVGDHGRERRRDARRRGRDEGRRPAARALREPRAGRRLGAFRAPLAHGRAAAAAL
jgi:IMP dehydrogenase/GMP reductase